MYSPVAEKVRGIFVLPQNIYFIHIFKCAELRYILDVRRFILIY